MDLQSLVAAHMPNRRRPTPMGAAAEDLYYRNQITAMIAARSASLSSIARSPTKDRSIA
ncbi:hypothetical protein ACCS53_37880 [Rhizobium ruizarguesonis]